MLNIAVVRVPDGVMDSVLGLQTYLEAPGPIGTYSSTFVCNRPMFYLPRQATYVSRPHSLLIPILTVVFFPAFEKEGEVALLRSVI